MWTLLTDCAKQIVPHCKLREKNDDYIKIYEIVEVESDQYKLQLVTKNDLTPTEEEVVVLKCQQLMAYNLEVEDVSDTPGKK